MILWQKDSFGSPQAAKYFNVTGVNVLSEGD